MRFVKIVVAVCALEAASHGQIGPSPAPTIVATNYDVQTVRVPAQSSSTQVAMTLAPATNGGDVLDVSTSDPSVVMSLILPGGQELTTANAASFGYTFSPVASGSTDTVDIASPVIAPGTHVVMTFPAGQVAGTYTVKLNASATATDSAATVYYLSAGTEEMAVATDSSLYSMNNHFTSQDRLLRELPLRTNVRRIPPGSSPRNVRIWTVCDSTAPRAAR